MRKIARFAIGLICMSLIVFFIAFLGLCAWAVGGPRDITQYADYIEKSANGTLANNHIKIGKTYLEWGGFNEFLSIKTTNVEIYSNKANGKMVALPEVVLKYGLTSLVTGHIIPSEIRLIAPKIDLTSILHKSSDNSSLSLEDFNLNRLSKVSIVNAALTAPDGMTWNLPAATLWYNDGGILINATVNNARGEAVQLSVRTDMKQSDNFIKANFTNFNTDTLRYYLPEIEPAHFVVNGRASYTSNPKHKTSTFNIDNLSGEFDDAKLFRNKLEVKSGIIAGTYDLNNKILDLQKLHINFKDNMRFGGRAKITNFTSFDVAANVSNLKTGNLKNYWPTNIAVNGLRWVAANLSGGEISEGTIVLKIKPEDMELPKLPREDVNIKFAFNGVSAKYLDNFTPVTNGSGTGTLDGDGLTINVTEASLNNSKITNTVVGLNSLGTKSEHLTLDGHIQGPVEDATEFYIKLSKGQKLFASKNDIAGNAVTDVTIKLPLIDNLKIDDVAYTVKAETLDGSIRNFYGLLGVNNLKLNLVANNTSYSAKGQCLASYGNKDTKFSLNSAPLGFDISGKGRQMRIAIASNITNSALEFSPLGIKKPAGEAGKLVAEVLDNGVNNPVINQFSIEAPSIKAVARGSFKRDYSSFANLEISTLQFGKTNMTARIISDPYLTAEFKGTYFDAAPVIRYLKKSRSSTEDDTPFKILLKADEVGLINNKYLKNAYITLQCGKSCDTININANGLSFNQGGGRLKVKTDNAGYVFDGFDLYSNMVGGKLDIEARVAGSDYDGKISIVDFSIVKAKVLARMLTIGSLTGIADIVQGKGISFKKLTTDVKMSKHQVSVSDYRMVGAAIGITAKGTIDRDKDTADISGNIIPAYTANTLLGEIPLIGPVIIGDEGVFALAYHLTGNIDDPSMNINPLSVLAPGFLKNVFQ